MGCPEIAGAALVVALFVGDFCVLAALGVALQPLTVRNLSELLMPWPPVPAK